MPTEHPNLVDEYRGTGRDERTFTTGIAADIAGLSQQTIIRQFDLKKQQGKPMGFIVPCSKFRRITSEGLRAFLKENDLEALMPETVAIVLAQRESARELLEPLVSDLPTGTVVRVTDDMFELGRLTARGGHVLVADRDLVSPKDVLERFEAAATPSENADEASIEETFIGLHDTPEEIVETVRVLLGRMHNRKKRGPDETSLMDRLRPHPAAVASPSTVPAA